MRQLTLNHRRIAPVQALGCKARVDVGDLAVSKLKRILLRVLVVERAGAGCGEMRVAGGGGVQRNGIGAAFCGGAVGA